MIEKYKRYLLLEKGGLSSNTIEAYMSDLQKLINFAESRQLTFNSIGQNHLEEFVADLHDKKNFSPPIHVPRYLGDKILFRFLLLDNYRMIIPAKCLNRPRSD